MSSRFNIPKKMFLKKILTTVAWFQMCFLRMVLVIGSRCENKSYVELFDPNDNSKFKCWPVPTCQEGQQPSVEPGSVHPKTTAISCIPCDNGWFSNRDTNYRCQKCTSCGNKDVHVNCSIYRDAVCSKRCKSKTHYFNETDGQCYACTECCGKDKLNIEPQCLLSSGNLRVGLVIGQQGEKHCKVLSSQKCDEQSRNITTYSNGSSVVVNSTSSVLENCNCDRPENNASSTHIDNNRRPSDCVWNSSLRIQDIILICALITVAIASAIFLYLYIRERRMRLSRNCCPSSSESCALMNLCYSPLAGQHTCETVANLLKDFEEKLTYIPEGVRINSIPYEVEEFIEKLDEKKLCAKNWYHVARKLRLSMDEVNRIKIEESREEGSPTLALISKLSTWDPVVTLRNFVRVLYQLGRHDISHPIIEFYRSGGQQAITSSV